MNHNGGVLVVIPARGGSKGIPRKNLRPLAGRPLIYYSITAALSSKLVSKVVVSTDDDEIALFASRFGADVLMRPHELADDATPLDPVVCHALKEMEVEAKYNYVVTVQPTSPLLTASDIDDVIRTISQGGYDTVLTVTEDRHLRWGKVGNDVSPLYLERVNRQLLPLEYKETGAVIACTREQIVEKGTRIGSAVEVKVMSPEKSFDVDSIADMYLCAALLNRKKNSVRCGWISCNRNGACI